MMNDQTANVSETKYYLLEITKPFGFKSRRADRRGSEYRGLAEVEKFLKAQAEAVQAGYEDPAEYAVFTDLASLYRYAYHANNEYRREVDVWRHQVYGEPLPA